MMCLLVLVVTAVDIVVVTEITNSLNTFD